MGYNSPIHEPAPTPVITARRPMNIQKINVGNVNILSISDCLMAVDACDFFPHKTVDAFQQFEGQVDDDCQVNGGINVACFLIESQGRRILVDAGLGPTPVAQAGGAAGNLLNEMRQGGIDPNTIDTVVITHLHFDHIGWLPNSLPDGSVRPTFPNAEYIVPQADWDLLFDPQLPSHVNGEGQGGGESPYPPAVEVFLDSLPVGRLMQKLDNIRPVEGDLNLTDEITIVPTPGHTPGHQSLAVTSQGNRAFVLGDVAHLPLQIQVPHWNTKADVLPELGIKTRRETLRKLADQGIIVAAGHFPAPGFGRIIAGETRRYWQPL